MAVKFHDDHETNIKWAYKLTGTMKSIRENLFLKIGFENGFVWGLIMLNQKPPEAHSNIIQLSDFYFWHSIKRLHTP